MSANRSKFNLSGTVRVCEAVIELGGRQFVSDATKAYLLVDFAHGPPSVTTYGETLWPGVVAAHFRTMQDQQVNFGHLLRVHYPELEADHMIGHIAAVEFPEEPAGGWVIPEKPEDAPAIRAVVCVSKLITGVTKMLTEIGHKPWSVSMEVEYYDHETAWMWRGSEGTVRSPDVISFAGGWKGIPAGKVFQDLAACYDPKTGTVNKKWNGMTVVRVLGGFSGSLHFMGLGMVTSPAEKAAGIRTVLASQSKGGATELRKFADGIFAGALEILSRK
jgi:hypothetical protein